ncbi:long-chain fatty acid--CoA ligase [Amycolatopsis acidicola]|uniref:Long-chain fatty acid--CoA ligase n=1 Tax=Amycolatopsis acidicola TaxID=2596893 RepID=A0A5N0V5Y2_9PSEU|nr:long-chain fatty acid--CoA ligase [Amycolatopsis acidicola]KAA9160510.1 long-chain fatty acid--CoA ligase [Amycolatopsis acidicola]
MSGAPIEAATLAEAFQRTVATYPEKPALRTVGGATELTWAQLDERVRAVAAGLDSLGVRKGDKVAILMRNLVENHLTDYAVAHLGAVPFGIFNTSSPEQIAYQVGHAEARLVITESRFLPGVRPAMSTLDGLVEHVVVVDGERAELGDLETTLRAVEGEHRPGFDFDAAWRAIEPEDVECIIYTSGTTGQPKAAQWSNRMIMSGLRSVDKAIPLPRRGVVSFMPMAHAGGRNNGHHYALAYGATLTVCPDFADVPASLVDVHPDLFMSSPRLFEKLQVAIEGMIESSPEPARTELRAAVALGLRFAHAEDAGFTGSIDDLAHLAGERQRGLELLKPILARIGFDRLEAVIIGGATVAPELVHFFRAVGAPMLEAYGATEVLLNVFNRVDDFKTGTAGKPLPDVELKLAEDGEVLCRGPLTMSGYYRDADKTAEVMDDEGWLRTGDIGELDADGFLRIIDRKKEIIINSHGKNMSPAVIETAITEESSLIAQFVAIGEARRYVTGLVTLDPVAVATFVKQHSELAGLSEEEVLRSPRIREEIQRAVDRGNARLNRNEQVKKFTVLGGAWEIDGDELTPTAKVKRRVVNRKYARQIDELYSE